MEAGLKLRSASLQRLCSLIPPLAVCLLSQQEEEMPDAFIEFLLYV